MITGKLWQDRVLPKALDLAKDWDRGPNVRAYIQEPCDSDFQPHVVRAGKDCISKAYKAVAEELLVEVQAAEKERDRLRVVVDELASRGADGFRVSLGYKEAGRMVLAVTGPSNREMEVAQMIKGLFQAVEACNETEGAE